MNLSYSKRLEAAELGRALALVVRGPRGDSIATNGFVDLGMPMHDANAAVASLRAAAALHATAHQLTRQARADRAFALSSGLASDAIDSRFESTMAAFSQAMTELDLWAPGSGPIFDAIVTALNSDRSDVPPLVAGRAMCIALGWNPPHPDLVIHAAGTFMGVAEAVMNALQGQFVYADVYEPATTVGPGGQPKTVTCPSCGLTYNRPLHRPGQWARCKSCQKRFPLDEA